MIFLLIAGAAFGCALIAGAVVRRRLPADGAVFLYGRTAEESGESANAEDGSRKDRKKERLFLQRWTNRGFAGDRLSDRPGIVTGVSAAAVFCFAALYIPTLWEEGAPLRKTGLSLMLGGALANLFERLRFGGVTDYLRFRKKNGKLSMIYNLADLFLFAGAALSAAGILLELLWGDR